MSEINPRVVVRTGVGGYGGDRALEYAFDGHIHHVDPTGQKHALVNAGVLCTWQDASFPERTLRVRLRDGTPVTVTGQWVTDATVLHAARHYLWQVFGGKPPPLGVFDVPAWVPEPLPDAYGPDDESLQYVPVDP